VVLVSPKWKASAVTSRSYCSLYPFLCRSLASQTGRVNCYPLDFISWLKSWLISDFGSD